MCLQSTRIQGLSQSFQWWCFPQHTKNVSFKIHLACLVSWMVHFSSSKICTLSSGSELKSIQKYNVNSIMTHFSRINHFLPHCKHSSCCTQSHIWEPLLLTTNSTAGWGLLSSLPTQQYTQAHPLHFKHQWIFDVQLQGSHNGGNVSSVEKSDSQNKTKPIHHLMQSPYCAASQALCQD